MLVRRSGLIDRRRAADLSYEEFVTKYMAANRPVIIQARNVLVV
jgi:hypothetical protein